MKISSQAIYVGNPFFSETIGLVYAAFRSVKAPALLLLLTTGFLITPKVFAEEKTRLGDWDVHHIVFSSTFLTPEIARENGIVRSKFNAVVNISVLDKDKQKAQNVSVTGSARNLLGTSKKLSFKKVADGDAIYYLAVFSYAHKENLRFEIDIQRGNDTHVLKLQQLMYVD